MKEINYTLKGEYIELIRLLKLLRFAGSGAQAKILVEEGLVRLNGKSENRKRAKLKRGDRVEIENAIIHIQ
jgi:ribosome-associated protein